MDATPPSRSERQEVRDRLVIAAPRYEEIAERMGCGPATVPQHAWGRARGGTGHPLRPVHRGGEAC